MSLRTRRSLAIWASLLFVVGACGTNTPAASPTGGTATGTPAAATGTAPAATGTAAATDEASPSAPAGSPSESPAETGGESPAATGGESPSASGGGEQDFEALLFNYEYTPQQGQPGGSVVISDWQAANQLNYYYSNAFANTQVLAATMRSLATVTSDGHWKEDLAASLPKFSDGTIRVDEEANSTCPTPEAPAASEGASPEPSPSAAEPTQGFEVDLTLKPGLLWSDGTPLTLNDLQYTWEWVMSPEQEGIVTLGWDLIDRFDVGSDGLTATVHFCQNFAGYFGTLLGSPPLPEHYMSQIPIAEANESSYPISPEIANAPVSGPFKYVTASADTIELARNENWKAGENGRQAYLERVTYRFFPDNKEGMIAAFKAGEIDVATDLLQGDYDAIKDVDPAVGRALIEPAWEYEHLDFNQSGLGPGKGHVALQDPAVRKAIAQAIDRTALYQTVFPGQPLPDPADVVCTNAPPGTYWRLEDASCLPFDMAAATAGLEAAGWVDGDGDGIREKDGQTLTLEHCTSQVPARELSANFLAGELQKIGVKLNVNLVDSTTVLFANWPEVAADTKCNLAHGNYDTSEFAYVLTFDVFGNYYYSYHSEQIPTDENEGNGYNYTRLSNPQMDEALNTLQSAIEPEDVLNAAYTVQEVYTTEVPEVVLYYRAATRGVSAKLQNFFQNPSTASDMWNIEDWFVTQ